MIPIVDVGADFYHRLANRDHNQGDGRHTAEEFRRRYLAPLLDNEAAWKMEGPAVTLDFKHVKKIGPSFANEAFAYFTKYGAAPKRVLDRIRIENATRVQMLIIVEEIEAGYGRK